MKLYGYYVNNVVNGIMKVVRVKQIFLNNMLIDLTYVNLVDNGKRK